MSGLRLMATSRALAISSSGFTRRPWNSLSCLSSSTSFIVRVTSTVTNSVTCGAVKAEPTIAAAVALRTPLTGIRVSRAVSYDATGAGITGVAVGAAAVGTVTTGSACFGVAAAWTSSRVMMPSGPDGVIVSRSTPRSLASLRTGGLASGRGFSATGAWPFSSDWIAWAGAGTLTSGPLRGRRLVADVPTP